jgi:hypothetical protein
MKLIQLLLLFVLFGSCNEIRDAVAEARKDGSPLPKDNYIVLLDMSDRLLNNNMQQGAKDIAVMKTVMGSFQAKIDEKDPTHLYYGVKDKMKVLLSPQKSTPVELYEKVGDYRLDLESVEADEKTALVKNVSEKLDKDLPDLYKKAVFSNDANKYSGADIWKYFSEDLEDDISSDAANTLFIVTDGYMNFENTAGRQSKKNRYSSCQQIINQLRGNADWSAKFEDGDYGLLPVGKKFKNLKVVLLEVNPNSEWSAEYSLLTKIWSKWFEEMGITDYHFIKSENINEVKESMEKCMAVKINEKIEVEKIDIAFADVIGKDAGSKPAGVVAGNEQSTVIATVSTPKPELPKAKPADVTKQDPVPVKKNQGVSSNPNKTDEFTEELPGVSVQKPAQSAVIKPKPKVPNVKAEKNDDILNEVVPKNKNH